MALPRPSVTVNLPAITPAISIAAAEAPDVSVLPTFAPTFQVAAPVVNMQPAAVSVAAPVVNVAGPVVTVAPPTISVAATAPTVNVTAASPPINVAAPNVTLTPTFAPVNNYAAPAITVTAAPPTINVSAVAPVVNVAASAAPQVTLNPTFAPVNNVAAPTVNVAAPQVSPTFAPAIAVTAAPPTINVNAVAPVVNFTPMVLGAGIPTSEARAGAAGAAGTAADAAHVHPTIASRTYHTLAADTSTPPNYVATVTYTRTFTARPLFAFGVLASSGQPVLVEHVSDIMGTGTQVGLFVGCVVRGRRAANLPTLSLSALLTSVISALSNFDPLGGNAAGTQVCVIALPPS